MRINTRLALVLTLTVGILIMTGAPAEAHHRLGPCNASRLHVNRHTMTIQEIKGRVRDLIRCAVHWRSVSGGVPQALAVAQCESGLIPWAVGGDNLGLFQHRDDYWPRRARALLDRSWFGRFPAPYGSPGDRRLAFWARANVLVSIRYAHRYGWGAWSCA